MGWVLKPIESMMVMNPVDGPTADRKYLGWRLYTDIASTDTDNV